MQSNTKIETLKTNFHDFQERVHMSLRIQAELES